jgi:hypothetical protein
MTGSARAALPGLGGRCPDASMWRSSCKKRGCPVCGPRWARDYGTVTRHALGVLDAPVVMLTITAPGARVLPWDRERCRHREGVKCSGTRHGCKVQQRALREWSDTATWRMGALRKAAYQATRRAGHVAPKWLERVWEPQKRGAPHLHIVLPFGDDAERDAVRFYAATVHRMAPEYGFGRVHDLTEPMPAGSAARYLTGYLLGRSRHKHGIRENIADPRLPKLLVWVSPTLTRVSGVTMRSLRRARHVWAATKGGCPPPRWSSVTEAVKIAAVFRSVYQDRAPPADVLAGALDLAGWMDRAQAWYPTDEDLTRFAFEALAA